MRKILLVYAIAMLLGVLTGLLGSCFQLAIKAMHSVLMQTIHTTQAHSLIAGLLVATLCTVSMVLLARTLVTRYAPEASGSGVQEIEGVLLHVRPVFWRRLIPVKFIGGTLAIAAGMVVGREGPSIQIGGNLGAMLGDVFRISRLRRDTLIAAGSAAGLAAAFNAPLAGILFIIEEMRNQFNFNFTNFKMVALCCVMATITTELLLGTAPAIPMDVFFMPELKSLWLFFLLGIVVGFAGLYFNQCLMAFLSCIDRFTTTQCMLYTAVVAAIIGLLGIYYPAAVGGGYDIIHQALSTLPHADTLFALFLFRFVATIACYSTAVPGGIFAPMMALGTLLGLFCFHGLHLLLPDSGVQPGMFAVAGMGALFSASIRAPLTGIVLVVEMTQNYSLILPLMVTCFTSTTVVQLAKNAPIYRQLLHRTLRNAVITG